tara:strand:- start:488 stop:604 length:117 start_codon:yes stop_codon:yes gene_type:complete
LEGIFYFLPDRIRQKYIEKYSKNAMIVMDLLAASRIDV